MKRKLNRILRPGMGIYFITMLAFSLVALLMDHPAVAAAEALITAAMYTAYILLRKLRHRNLLRYLEKNHETVESAGKGKSPFPTMVVRLSDGTIIWANDLFAKITGFSDLLSEQSISDLLPGFSVDWLTDQKTESPTDAAIHGRRYRVYATRTTAPLWAYSISAT